MDLNRLYEWHHFVVGIGGVVATLHITRPGEHSVALGPVSVDLFYVILISALALVTLSGHTLWTMYDDR
ncbi:hypothetical protein NDI56_01800 [Haloarcula sp. S1CR25-12]|uniref:Uncharacterized protein n=1 Tax=Haloarcula saliterrae TaxID=2950534 RepID=A0ABU2F880_9EURY|nr:hypothetical protein [Haloarcula sp. S1CR25-12]MDS0258138.1 hypothetical protein [Haloarcula sp. S1CR25-12]